MTSPSPSPASKSSQLTRSNILLDSGTNELEVLVFTLGECVFGVNVAKVREVITTIEPVASPNQPTCVLGMFNLRGGVLPLVDLHRYLEVKPHDANENNWRIIVTEFNGQRAAFRVESVEQIHRMSWKDVKPVPETGTGGEHHFAVTGIAQIQERLILMLDFESIFDHISLQKGLHVDFVANDLGVNRGEHHIFVAEDSKFIRNMMNNALTSSGYNKITLFTNGQDCWDQLEQAAADNQPPALLVTDIEMPQMDGLALAKNVKSHTRLQKMPVILFSSLITEDTQHKGKAVGVDDQISKPQLPQLVNIIDAWVSKIESRKAA